MTETVRADAIARAAQIADEVLFPAALEVDTADRVPASHLDLLAGEGLYGMAGPREYGGLGLDMTESCELIEHLAGGCLATAFVWIQHHSTVLSLAYGQNAELRERWLSRLCSGEVRAGIALNGVRPGASAVRARPAGDGYVLDGATDWVTGWGMIDLLRVAARDENGDIVYSLVDPVESARLRASTLDLIAARASNTMRVEFDGLRVPAERVVGVQPSAAFEGNDTRPLRVNASLALGVAARCARMIGEDSPLHAQITAQRSELDGADEDTISAARANTSELTMRAAAALVTATGSRSVLPGMHAGRLAREALFLLVFASRPSIKEALVNRLSEPQVPINARNDAPPPAGTRT